MLLCKTFIFHSKITGKAKGKAGQQNEGNICICHFNINIIHLWGCNSTYVFLRQRIHMSGGLIQLVLLVSIQTFKKHCKHCKTLPNILKHDISDLFILTHHFCVTVQQYKCFLSIISALLLVICNKPFLVCVQTQEHIAFLTFPPWHTLWTEVASSLLVTVQRPVSTIIVAHI